MMFLTDLGVDEDDEEPLTLPNVNVFIYYIFKGVLQI
jgi:hypothetical protein